MRNWKAPCSDFGECYEMECGLELTLFDHPPMYLLYTSWPNPSAEYCFPPRTGDKDILGVIPTWWKRTTLSAISFDSQPPPRSTTHVGLRFSTAKVVKPKVKGLSLAECFDSELRSKATSFYQIRLRIPIHQRLLATDVYIQSFA